MVNSEDMLDDIDDGASTITDFDIYSNESSSDASSVSSSTLRTVQSVAGTSNSLLGGPNLSLVTI